MLLDTVTVLSLEPNKYFAKEKKHRWSLTVCLGTEWADTCRDIDWFDPHWWSCDTVWASIGKLLEGEQKSERQTGQEGGRNIGNQILKRKQREGEKRSMREKGSRERTAAFLFVFVRLSSRDKRHFSAEASHLCLSLCSFHPLLLSFYPLL